MFNKDDLHLAALQDDYARNGVIPSFAGIAKIVNFKSTSSVSALISRLKAAGYLDSTVGRRLAPTKKFFERALVNSVRAGIPEEFKDARFDIFNLDSFLIEKPSHTVILEVKGDSMVDAGLLDGDRVAVVRGAPCRAGDVVVAIVDNHLTVKYLGFDKQGYHLKPGNRAYKIIRPKEQLEIYGLVTSSFRKYKKSTYGLND